MVFGGMNRQAARLLGATDFFVKTKWGSCNHAAGNIRLNTELVKKPKDLVEYVVVHEMLHLLEPTHNPDFVRLLTRHWPHWQESRRELDELPLAPEHMIARIPSVRSGAAAAS